MLLKAKFSRTFLLSSRHALLLVVALLLLFTTRTTVVAADSSVRALNEFGHADVLQHAEAAATTQGSSVIILQRHDDTVVLQVPRAAPAPHQRHSSSASMVQQVSMPTNDGTSAAYLICSGLAGDARWLVQRLRQYTSRGWLTADTATLSAASLAKATSNLLQLFWGHPIGLAVASPTLRPLLQQQSDDDVTWGRPLGLQVALICLDNSSDATTKTLVYVLNPAGNIVCTNDFSSKKRKGIQILACLGHKQDAVRQALEQRLVIADKNAEPTTTTTDEDDNNKWLQDHVVPAIAQGLGLSVSALLQSRTVQVQTLSSSLSLRSNKQPPVVVLRKP